MGCGCFVGCGSGGGCLGVVVLGVGVVDCLGVFVDYCGCVGVDFGYVVVLVW